MSHFLGKISQERVDGESSRVLFSELQAMKYHLLITALGVMVASPAYSAITLTTGTGSAVKTVDRTASFNALKPGDDLSAYSEDFLSITTPGLAIPYSDVFNGAGDGTPYFYPGGGNPAVPN